MRSECLRDMKGHIDAYFVEETHGPHGHAEIEHGFIEIRDAGAEFEKISRFNQVRHQDSIYEEPGTVLDDHRELADLLHETQGACEHFRRGLAGSDDLDELHAVDRVEEMQAENPLWPARAGGQFRDRQSGGVGGQDRVLTGKFVETL